MTTYCGSCISSKRGSRLVEQAESALYWACHTLKIRIPEDISIIGLGGNFMLNGFSPLLAHYRFDYTELLELIR